MLKEFLVISAFYTAVGSYKFLALCPFPIKSHFIFMEKLLLGLVNKGHQVDVISHFPQKKFVQGYKDFSIAGSLPILIDNVSMSNTDFLGVLNSGMFIYRNYGPNVCKNILDHPSVLEVKQKNSKYDAILTEVFGTDCLLGFAHLFAVPIIGITCTFHLPWGYDRMGNPDNPSYVPNYFVSNINKMDIGQKIVAFGLYGLSKISYHLLSTIPSEVKARDFFGSNMPPLDILAYNTTLMLSNTHFSVNEPQPFVPGFIEVGGLHIDKLKPLPKALEVIINSNKRDLIFFSMGTVINMNTFSKEKLQLFLDIFSELPFTVFLKGRKEDLPENLPSNVYVENWFPQVDLLCDERMKLFVTHGGLNSIHEAAYCGVPILGIPIFADHHLNVLNYERKKAGLHLDYKDVTKELVLKKITALLSNNTFQENAVKLSNIYKDRPLKPMDNAVYWLEYTIRNDGAKFLRSRSTDLIWFEYYLIDIILLFFLVFFIVAIFFFYVANRKEWASVTTEKIKSI